MAAPTTRRAPGKLMVAGEYAVLEPGRPAIVAAMDRYVTVTASAAAEEADVVIGSDLLEHEVRLRRGPQGLEALPGQDPAPVRGVLAHVVSAVETIEQLRTERGLGLAPVRLSVRSDLHRAGVKTGLGSSAAVTVASIRALADHYGMRLSTDDRFRLALLAGVRVDARPSGADLAASTWQGWVSYRSPDRQALLNDLHRHGVTHTLERPWAHVAVRPLPPPTGLTLHVGWSGSPASTTALVADLATRPEWHGAPRTRFLDDSEQCVSAAERALRDEETQALLDAVRTARSLLTRLDAETSLGIVTAPLHRLCEVAESCGAAAKPSGAGGGDCGIALLPAGRSAELLRRRWTAAGITPLPLRVTADVADDAGREARAVPGRTTGTSPLPHEDTPDDRTPAQG
ncbi:phosphomevalonate kinase [Streptomyces scabiei]|uniref:phosphomevalonate kinase n=1 Tax=Streptomyces scabiei TaxID=1930 RepID=UPI0036E0A5AB